MTRQLIAASALALSLGLPAQAFDLSKLTEAERTALRDEVRSYLLDNPEVIMEAIETLMIHNGIDSPGIGAMARTALAKVRDGDA